AYSVEDIGSEMVEHISSQAVLDYYGSSTLPNSACQHSPCQLVVCRHHEVGLLHHTRPADEASEGCKDIDRLLHLDISCDGARGPGRKCTLILSAQRRDVTQRRPNERETLAVHRLQRDLAVHRALRQRRRLGGDVCAPPARQPVDSLDATERGVDVED